MPTEVITVADPSVPSLTAVPTAVITGTTINPTVYALLPPDTRVAGPTAVTIGVPTSNPAPSTDTDTVSDNGTVVTAVVPTIASLVG